MFDKDKWKEIYAVLSKNKLRTFLTAFGVFWGIFMLIIMLGSGNGLRNGINSSMSSYATNTFFMWTQHTSIPYKGYQSGRRFNFNNNDTKVIQRLPEVQYVCPRGQLGGHNSSNNVIYNEKTGSFNINADMPEYIKVHPLKIISGRYINDLDIKRKRKVAVIGQPVVNVLFAKGENPIGKYIEIQGVYFQVVGVFALVNSSVHVNDNGQTVYIPFTTFQQAFNFPNVVMWYAITSKPNIPAAETAAKVLKLMAKNHTVSPLDKRAFGHYNLQKEFSKLQGLFLGIRILIWVVGIGTLFSGVIGISNIMLVIVKERTKEIGVRRAIGAKPSNIIGQILMEALTLTFIAGYFGMAAGVGLLELANNIIHGGSGMFQNPSVDIAVAIKALIILIVCGVFAGLIPAYRAIKIKPVDALRAE